MGHKRQGGRRRATPIRSSASYRLLAYL